MRYAIYFTPPPGEPLTLAAESWLGRSAFSGAAFAMPAEREAITVSARRYGFHATMKAPFRLADGMSEAQLIDDFEQWTAARHAFTGPRLVIDTIDGFFALVPKERYEALETLARDIVVDFESFRAPLTLEDFERRRPDRLAPAERGYLDTYGYPYVLDAFRFHMTLTDRVPAQDTAKVAEELNAHFGTLPDDPIHVSTLALFAESEPGAPFRVLALRELASQSMRKTA